jgi:SNF2 family DNA or RNA helicase
MVWSKCCAYRPHVLASDAIAAIDQYNKHESDKFILLTTRSDGLSIHFTTADTAVLYDSDWHMASPSFLR